MKLATANFPKSKISHITKIYSYSLSTIIILMVISQLMTIEKFLPIVENYQLPGDSPTAKIIIFTLATSGVFALPFLLRMNLSPLFRIFSAILLNIYGLIWFGLGLWVYFTNPPLIGTGIFGSLLKSISSEFILPFASVLLVSCIIATILLRKDLMFKS